MHSCLYIHSTRMFFLFPMNGIPKGLTDTPKGLNMEVKPSERENEKPYESLPPLTDVTHFSIVACINC